jgi:DNA repair protein SbcC/Rad50
VRLHNLEVTAFGPFSGTEAIDFDALSDAGLFLINGQTGAGKTSVLDAICFALYGQIPGVRNAIKTLRSDHAAPGIGPKVVLEVTIRGRRLRIMRSPAWERPKQRGTGTKFEHSHVVVQEHTGGDWQGVTTRLDEAGDFLGGLLGMNAAQFCQVAMLPQGDFAVFLRAGAEDRRKVLEKLFATEIYAAVEKWLADRRAATRRDAEALEQAATSTADRIAETSGASRADGDLLAWAAEISGQLEAVLEVNEALLRESLPAVQSAQSALAAGRELSGLQERHTKELVRRDALVAAAPERAALAVRLDAAGRADRVLPLIKVAEQRKTTAGRELTATVQARRRIAAWAPEDAPADVLLKAERARRDEAAGLRPQLDEVNRHRTITREITDLQAAERILEGEESSLRQVLTELPGLVEAGRKELEASRIAAAGLPAATKAAKDAADLIEAARHRDLLMGTLTKAEDAERAATDVAQRTRGHLQDLREARIQGMAAALAADLVDGEPCKVCGSEVHPAPSAALGLVPSDADQARAEQADDRAQKDREQATNQVVGLRAELDAALERTDASVADLAVALDAAELHRAGCAEAVTLAEQLNLQLTQAESQLAGARDKHAKAVQDLTSARTTLAGRLTEESRLRAALDLARGTDPSIEARITRINAEADLLHAAAEAINRADQADQEFAAALSHAEQAAKAEGFASLQDTAAALLPAHERARLQERERHFADEEAGIRERLEDPALQAAAAAPAPDLPALESVLAAAEHAHSRVVSARDRARIRSDRLTELRADLHDRMAAWEPAAERHRVAERLAGITSGLMANKRNMRLSAYVLTARLEQVVAAANERLARMSAGRYLLDTTEDKTAGDTRRASGGLGLRVTDAWTGRQRDPVTLSGGESFLTSLALALGLADVVTAEAGGTEIGTLFVDEGFGTLDEDTLDEVMDVLDGLRDGGRTVGIVSHVAELRTRIPAQLRVRKDRTGSRVSITT